MMIARGVGARPRVRARARERSGGGSRLGAGPSPDEGPTPITIRGGGYRPHKIGLMVLWRVSGEGKPLRGGLEPRVRSARKGSSDRRAPRGHGRRRRCGEQVATCGAAPGADPPPRGRPPAAPGLPLASLRDRQRRRRHPSPRSAARATRSGDAWRRGEFRPRPRVPHSGAHSRPRQPPTRCSTTSHSFERRSLRTRRSSQRSRAM